MKMKTGIFALKQKKVKTPVVILTVIWETDASVVLLMLGVFLPSRLCHGFGETFSKTNNFALRDHRVLEGLRTRRVCALTPSFNPITQKQRAEKTR